MKNLASSKFYLIAKISIGHSISLVTEKEVLPLGISISGSSLSPPWGLGLIHHPCPAIFRQDMAGPTNIKYFIESPTVEFLFPHLKPLNHSTSRQDFKTVRYAPPFGRTTSSQTNQIPRSNSIQQTVVAMLHKFPVCSFAIFRHKQYLPLIGHDTAHEQVAIGDLRKCCTPQRGLLGDQRRPHATGGRNEGCGKMPNRGLTALHHRAGMVSRADASPQWRGGTEIAHEEQLRVYNGGGEPIPP